MSFRLLHRIERCGNHLFMRVCVMVRWSLGHLVNQALNPETLQPPLAMTRPLESPVSSKRGGVWESPQDRVYCIHSEGLAICKPHTVNIEHRMATLKMDFRRVCMHACMHV